MQACGGFRRLGRQIRTPLIGLLAAGMMSTSFALGNTAAGAATSPTAIRHRLLTTKGPRSSFTGEVPMVSITGSGKSKNANRREAFFTAAAPNAYDSESCATWTSENGDQVQRGAAFRVHKVAGNGTRAVAVLRDILGDRGIFNFTLFDTTLPAKHFQIGHMDLGGSLGGIPLPWKFCARLVGNRLAFKAWPANAPVPAYGDATHGGSVTLPAGWTAPGKTGWYIGHLRTGNWAQFTELGTTILR